MHLLHGCIIKSPKPHSGSDKMHRHHHFAILFKSLLKPLIEANGLVLQWIKVSGALWWGYCLSLASLLSLCSCLNLRTAPVGLWVSGDAGGAEAAYSKAIYMKDLCANTQVPHIKVLEPRVQRDSCRTQHTLHCLFLNVLTSYSLELRQQSFSTTVLLRHLMCASCIIMNKQYEMRSRCVKVCVYALLLKWL